MSTYLYGTFESGFTLKRVRDIIRIYSQILRADKYPQHGSIIWPVWPNCWVFNHKLSGCGFESSCSHLNFRFRAFFEQGVPWHSDNYRVWVHSETRMWHDKNIQFIELCFLQPNTVSITQPIDKGIILSLKAKYRSECFYKWSRQLIQTSLLKMWIY